MQKRILCVVLAYCCVWGNVRLAAGGLTLPQRVVSKIVAKVGKVSQLGQKVGVAALVVGVCANLLSCGEEGFFYRDYAANEAQGLPIMQGATTASETQVFVLTESRDNYIYSLLDEHGEMISPATSDKRTRQGADEVMQHMSFQGLNPNSEYLLQVHTLAGELLDERELRTLDPSRQELRFAFGSCMHDYEPQGDIWQQMVALHPDVIFLIGDNVYTNTAGDITIPDFMWVRYVSARQWINLFRSRQLIPVVAVWDDHDYGMSNGDLTYPYKSEALEIFKTFFVSDKTDNFYQPNIGAASFFSIYGYNFFLLDNRSFRTPRFNSPEWHFGEAQSQWLLDNLAGVDNAFIISGDQFFGGYIEKDSFQGNHPERFVDFLAELKASDAKVAFLSGDRHFTEIMQIPVELLGYQTYEFTSSPLHSNYRGLPRNNPLRIAGQASAKNNFMLIEASKTSDGLQLQVTSYTVGGKLLFSGEYKID